MDINSPPAVELRSAVQRRLHQPHHPGVMNLAVWLDTKIICPGGRWNQPGLKWSILSLRLGDLARN